jgi:hypothetical protein
MAFRAEIGPDDLRVLGDLRRRALGDLLAEVQHAHTIGQAHERADVSAQARAEALGRWPDDNEGVRLENRAP